MLGSRRATRKEAQIDAECCPNGHESILESEDPRGERLGSEMDWLCLRVIAFSCTPASSQFSPPRSPVLAWPQGSTVVGRNKLPWAICGFFLSGWQWFYLQSRDHWQTFVSLQKFICWNPNPQRWWHWEMEDFGGRFNHDCGAFTSGICALWKRIHRDL